MDVAAAGDPVRAVLDAHEQGRPIALRTSGTSAHPRAVRRTTASWFDSFPHVEALTGLTSSSRVWVPGPLGATMNLFAAVHATCLGARLVDGPGAATHAQLTPAQLRRALDEAALLSGVHVVVAGDRLGADLREQAVRAGARVSHYYGAAELSFVAWGPDETGLEAFPDVEVAIRQGRLWVRSPYLSQGYLGPAGPYRVDEDGFATVGDRGRLDGRRLVVLGRDEQTVVTAGATVHVSDVEEVLRATGPGQVVVVGVRHEVLGAVVAAVLTDASALPAARDLARAGLPPAARPRVWFHLPALPLTSAGKVDRRAVEAAVSSGEGVRRLAVPPG